MSDIDCVIIGRNVEKTLKSCIESVEASQYTRGKVKIIYVDGGSSDASVLIARAVPDVEVIEIGDVQPTPGLGRNLGFRAGSAPFIQFIDADTTLSPDWLQVGTKHMAEGVGAVFGQRKEAKRDATRYNMIADIEWTPLTGDAFGGDVLIRRSVIEERGGYDEDMVAGEDPELAQRIVKAGHKIIHVAAPMTEHDIDMHRWDQWWRRAYRTGYGFASVQKRHPGACHEEMQRILRRGGVSVLAIIVGVILAAFSSWWLLLWLGAALLILWPRIFKIEQFQKARGIPLDEAALYAWHCSLVVVPQFFGVMRYWWASRFGTPMRVAACLLLLVAVSGCFKPIRTKLSHNGIEEGNFELIEQVPEVFADAEQVEIFNGEPETGYVMGPGDILSIFVAGRPQFTSTEMVTGPDGVVSPIGLGDINVLGRTRAQVVDELVDRLAFLYRNPMVTLSINYYNNNKAYVFGRVSEPGIVRFSGPGNLLEAISLAGGLMRSGRSRRGDEGAAGERGAGAAVTPRKASIVRGKNQIINIDLADLLKRGNVSLNARVKNNDIIYIHDPEGEFIYVVGEVRFPRVYPFTADMTYLDAVMQAGGLTQDADWKYTYVIRPIKGKGVAIRVNFEDIMQCRSVWQNFGLKEGDIIFVGQRGMAKFAYRMNELKAGLDVIDVTTDILEEFGVMGSIRRALGTNDENAVFVQ